MSLQPPASFHVQSTCYQFGAFLINSSIIQLTSPFRIPINARQMGICLCSRHLSFLHLYVSPRYPDHAVKISYYIQGGFAYGVSVFVQFNYHELIELFVFQLLDVLNAHFQVIFRIDKTRSTLLQLAYFGAYLVWSPFAGIFVGYFVCPERFFN